MENFSFAEESYLFTCPACYQQILNSEIHEHIQNCEMYSPHDSIAESYSSLNTSNASNSYRYNYSSNSSSVSEFKDGHRYDDSSVGSLPSAPSKTHSIAVCPVCFYNYHNTRHTPLLLPSCGHTVCKPCLKDIRDKSNKFCCPICRSINKISIKLLPINYALLELTEKKKTTKCYQHQLEHVAYCNDDDTVLCGACIFEHKSHSCILLTDNEKLEPLSQQKKILLKQNTEELWVIKKN